MRSRTSATVVIALAVDLPAVALHLRPVRFNWPHAAVAVACLMLVACSHAAATDVPSSERLWVASLALMPPLEGELDAVVASERRRILDLCPPPWPNRTGCVTRNLQPHRRRAATLLAEPRAGSAPVADVYMVLRPRSSEYDVMTVGLDLERVPARGAFIPWIEDAGDWGYGIPVDGDVRVDGQWVQLVRPWLGQPAWLPMEGTTLRVVADPLQDQILDLAGVASDSGGHSGSVANGSYLVLKVSSTGIEFRQEVESDFACGDDVAPPAVMPPILHAESAALFTADGAPRFRTKYTKGC